MNPMMMGGGMGGIPGMSSSTGGMPQTPGSSQMQPGGDQMLALLQMLGNPLGSAQASQGGQQPLSPQMQAILSQMTQGGQQQPSNQQVPQMLALMQAMAGGMGGGGMGGPQMQQPPMQQPY